MVSPNGESVAVIGCNNLSLYSLDSNKYQLDSETALASGGADDCSRYLPSASFSDDGQVFGIVGRSLAVLRREERYAMLNVVERDSKQFYNMTAANPWSTSSDLLTMETH